uniref:Uncharacterized protein n=1 Tax=Lepeophtheirus salmonis TaxID=72036 RepID=A0A0K2TRL1_LEPSM
MGKDTELVDAAREGNYPLCEKLLSSKPKRAGPFASGRSYNKVIKICASCLHHSRHHGGSLVVRE